jgi:predicted RNA binding protein YcfA (HicA-like mRNA interferase family)
MKVRDLIRALEERGWKLRAIRGSHRQYKHAERAEVVTIAGKENQDLPIGTLRAILKAAGIDPREMGQ